MSHPKSNATLDSTPDGKQAETNQAFGWNGPQGAKPTVLIVDDEQMMRNLLTMSLQRLGYAVLPAANGREAVESFRSHPVDLVVLDVMMPVLDGFDTCIELRKRSTVPIVMLTALSRPDDVVRGLELGADNYITKPFTFRELEARIQAILRRTMTAEGAMQRIFEEGDICLDDEQHLVTVRGEEVELTNIEYQLLYHLIANPGQPVSKPELLAKIWGYAGDDSTNLVEIAMRRLRLKVEADPSDPDYLLTVRSIGYKFQPPRVAANHGRGAVADAMGHRNGGPAKPAPYVNGVKETALQGQPASA